MAPQEWRQDWNTGDADTSGSSDGELYGLQKGKGKGKSGSFNGICYNCGKSGRRPSSVSQKGGKAKGKGKKGDSKGWNDSKGGQSERDGQKVKVGTRQVKVGTNKASRNEQFGA